MAKKTIQVCDFCKAEYDEDFTNIITIKEKGKKKGRSYDLCPNCAEQLEQKLVSKASTGGFTIPSRPAEPAPAQFTSRREALADLDLDENDLLIQEKTVGETTNRVQNNSKCIHMNRTRIKTGIFNGNKKFYQRCRDCGKDLPLKSTEERYKLTHPKTNGLDINLKEDYDASSQE